MLNIYFVVIGFFLSLISCPLWSIAYFPKYEIRIITLYLMTLSVNTDVCVIIWIELWFPFSLLLTCNLRPKSRTFSLIFASSITKKDCFPSVKIDPNPLLASSSATFIAKTIPCVDKTLFAPIAFLGVEYLFIKKFRFLGKDSFYKPEYESYVLHTIRTVDHPWNNSEKRLIVFSLVEKRLRNKNEKSKLLWF